MRLPFASNPASSCSERANPATSVLWPISLPSACTIVFTAPAFAAVSLVPSRNGTTACLCGIVTFAPRKSAPRSEFTRPSSTSGAVSHASYVASMPAASNAALKIAGLTVCPSGCADDSGALRHVVAPLLLLLPVPLDVPQVLLQRLGKQRACRRPSPRRTGSSSAPAASLPGSRPAPDSRSAPASGPRYTYVLYGESSLRSSTVSSFFQYAVLRHARRVFARRRTAPSGPPAARCPPAAGSGTRWR